MIFKEFEAFYFNSILDQKPAYIRKGQALMNYLAEISLEEYNKITSLHYYDQTDIDCFYNDRLIPNTLKHLERVWPLITLN